MRISVGMKLCVGGGAGCWSLLLLLQLQASHIPTCLLSTQHATGMKWVTVYAAPSGTRDLPGAGTKEMCDIAGIKSILVSAGFMPVCSAGSDGERMAVTANNIRIAGSDWGAPFLRLRGGVQGMDDSWRPREMGIAKSKRQARVERGKKLKAVMRGRERQVFYYTLFTFVRCIRNVVVFRGATGTKKCLSRTRPSRASGTRSEQCSRPSDGSCAKWRERRPISRGPLANPFRVSRCHYSPRTHTFALMQMCLTCRWLRRRDKALVLLLRARARESARVRERERESDRKEILLLRIRELMQ